MHLHQPEDGRPLQGVGKTVERGNVEEAWQLEGCTVFEGSTAVGGQEHFYLEPHVCTCEPREEEEMIVHATTQVRPSTRRGCGAQLQGLQLPSPLRALLPGAPLHLRAQGGGWIGFARHLPGLPPVHMHGVSCRVAHVHRAQAGCAPSCQPCINRLCAGEHACDIPWLPGRSRISYCCGTSTPDARISQQGSHGPVPPHEHRAEHAIACAHPDLLSPRSQSRATSRTWPRRWGWPRTRWSARSSAWAAALVARS